MSKLIALVAAVAMMALMALPAAALSPDAGVFTGTATVSEPAAACGSGPGGLGFLPGDAAGGWQIDAPVGAVLSALYGPGSLTLCGGLAPTTPLGSCSSSSGYDGRGSATFATGSTSLTNVGWTISAAGSFVVTGTADGGAGLTALVQALDEAVAVECVQGVADVFTVVAVYAIA